MTAVLDLPPLPAIVAGDVAHRRRGATAHRFRHRVYQWLIDLDAPPRLPRPLRPFARFSARDHLGALDTDDTRAIKSNVETFLRANGIETGPGSRILMLANARVLGYVFDPLSVYWCLDAAGTVTCVVAEVHNTYGERTAYLLHPDRDGHAEADKHFYVSPFNDVSGRYRMTFRLDADRIGVTIILDRAGMEPFTATFTGVPQPATPRRVARSILTMPLMPQRVSLLIAVHGIWLWARRLRVVPRPPHTPPQEV
ncbi:hypothetical protein ASG12_08560 [Williamsia sp. Leaf354]|uniref:DUF1365 domain-containing protein n=1 Tax=Williamsia sp. Leaf354 TaxID=1736349 RepID=UPI0006F2AFF1|nr:DUF1365 domain-containing protein [Williamsia sp. Leaf354]KQR98483.1 hypothetical protein ASG12_08560 [Williamsia sp. Leaf354]